jgi:hypothetical protein
VLRRCALVSVPSSPALQTLPTDHVATLEYILFTQN